jgi:hypothetical protein
MDRRSLLLQNREYQQRLEQMVAERTEHLELRMSELTALNTLFQSHLNQALATQDADSRLQAAVTDFGGQLTDLAHMAKVVGSERPAVEIEARRRRSAGHLEQAESGAGAPGARA